jgi:hypothetical protein
MAHQTHHGVYQAAASVADAIHAMFTGTMGVSGVTYDLAEAATALTMF